MLTERLKADRAQMVARLSALAHTFGFGAELEPEPSFLGKRASIINFSFPHGLRLSLDFDGASSQPDTFVVSWYMHGPDAEGWKIASGFAPSVNQFHHHKATDVVEGFYLLESLLRLRFEAIADGRAFVLA